jgi:hypothetical protein
LHLNTTVTEVHGKNRLTGVSVAQVDDQRRPIENSRREIECDTLLLSIGLIPENELTRQAQIPIADRTSGAIVDDALMTAIPGIFSCGNVLHVHDLVDFVSDEAELAGTNAALYLDGGLPEADDYVHIDAKDGVGYAMPQKVSGKQDFTLSLRVTSPSRERYVWVRTDDGRKVTRKKKIRLHPAEMVRLKIKAEKIKGAKALEVGVE